MKARHLRYIDARSPWLRQIPAHWRVGRLSQVAVAWTSNVDKHSVDGQLPVRLCNYTDVYKNDSILGDMAFMTATATPEQVARFRLRRGDTLITKDSETADDIGIPAYVEYEAEDLICGYHLAMIRPDRRAVNPRFLYWAMNAKPVMDQWAVLASGVTRVGIRSTDLTKVVLALPPVSEQQAVADYLDRETTRIDSLVAEQERLVEVLRERRAVVTDQVTWRGLSPDDTMGETGIGTAPLAPTHWLRRRNKHLLRESSAVSTDGSEELLTVSHLTGITPRSQKTVNMFEAETLIGYRLVEAGDLVINTMWAWMGALGVSSYDGVVSPAYGVYRPMPNASFDGRYFDYLYRSRPYVVEMTRHSRGVWESRLRLYPESFLRLPVVVPPLQEQRRIVDYLDAQTRAIDVLIAEAEGIVDVARERRSALITAAVTGQIDVRGEVA